MSVFVEAAEERLVVEDIPEAVFDLFEADVFVIERLTQEVWAGLAQAGFFRHRAGRREVMRGILLQMRKDSRSRSQASRKAAYDRSDMSRREAQIMESLYRRQRATARDVLADLPDPPIYSAVRKMLEILERKGHVGRTIEGRRYVYFPVVPRAAAGRSVLRQLVGTFFGGSVEDAVSALLEEGDVRLSESDLKRIARLARRAAGKGG